ncbi:MAG: hypothetical protein MJZ40_05445 [Bacteroidaceae bacterium]|nr:hypothetical protein [Bacteroidaceae bacterium]
MRDKLFYLRNILNVVFILLAIGAMVGVLVCKSSTGQNICYAVALVAVIIKIIEVILRTPSMTRKTQYEQRRYHQRRNTRLSETESPE